MTTDDKKRRDRAIRDIYIDDPAITTEEIARQFGVSKRTVARAVAVLSVRRRDKRLIEERRAMNDQPYMGRTFSFAEWYAGFLAGRGPRWQFPMLTRRHA